MKDHKNGLREAQRPLSTPDSKEPRSDGLSRENDHQVDGGETSRSGGNKEYWAPIPVNFIRDCRLSMDARWIGVVLASYANWQTRECYPLASTLRRVSGLGRDRVRNAVAELQGARQIKVSRRQIKGRFHTGHLDETYVSQYTGAHHPIEKDVNLLDIHKYDGEKRNTVMPVVKEIMDEVCRIFGFSKTLIGVWDEQGKLGYVKNLENQR